MTKKELETVNINKIVNESGDVTHSLTEIKRIRNNTMHSHTSTTYIT